MTTQEFDSLWKNGKPVYWSEDAPIPCSNFQSFPEQCERIETEGTFYGFHFSFEEITEFYADFEICMITLDKFNGREFSEVIAAMKDNHGPHVYMVKMSAHEDIPVFFYEHEVEARTLTYRCRFRHINL